MRCQGREQSTGCLELVPAFILTILTKAWLPGGPKLVIKQNCGSTPFLIIPFDPNEYFILHYNHSVDKTSRLSK